MRQSLHAIILKLCKPKCSDQVCIVIKLVRKDLNIFKLGSMEIKACFEYIGSQNFIKLKF